MSVSAQIKAHALELGFSACGIARCRKLDTQVGVLKEWLDAGCNAGMDYMARWFDQRADPSLLVEGARSVVVCLAGYGSNTGGDSGIASYAHYEDYHHTLKHAAGELSALITELVPGACARGFVDTAPVMEKVWAVEAGLGWRGRNSMVVNRALGSFTFISEIVTDAVLEYDTPCTDDHCGSCRRCLDSCPTGAIRPDRTVDANRCLSYHTIESRGPIPEDIMDKMNGSVFGCDICQNACPWNAASKSQPSPLLVPAPVCLSDEEWLEMGSSRFRRLFGRSPLARAGLKRIKYYIGIRNRS